MKLNLGCGKRKLEGFINVDGDENVFPDIIMRLDLIRKVSIFGIGAQNFLFPMDMANSVDEIVMYDVIEHFSPAGARRLLEDCYYMLKEGGKLLLRTNDLDRLVRQYAAEKFLGIKGSIDWDKFVWHLFCEPDNENIYMGHKWGYNKESMEKLLRDVGFADAVIREDVTVREARIHFFSEPILGAGMYPYCEVTCDLTNMVVEVVK